MHWSRLVPGHGASGLFPLRLRLKFFRGVSTAWTVLPAEYSQVWWFYLILLLISGQKFLIHYSDSKKNNKELLKKWWNHRSLQHRGIPVLVWVNRGLQFFTAGTGEAQPQSLVHVLSLVCITIICHLLPQRVPPYPPPTDTLSLLTNIWTCLVTWLRPGLRAEMGSGLAR